MTSNVAAATTAFDHVLLDWSDAGLEQQSAVRSYFGMAVNEDLEIVGTLSARDLKALKRCIGRVFEQ